jgi:hypothetical protein
MSQLAIAGIAFVAILGGAIAFSAIGLWYMGPPK